MWGHSLCICPRIDEAPRQGTCCWLLAHCAWWDTESDQSCSNTFSVTTYPSVLLCVAQETWPLHTNLGSENLAHRHWPSAIGWLGMWMMIAKAHMRGLWEACRCCCCILFTLYVSPSFHFRFTLISFHTARHIEAIDVHWCLLCRHGFVMRSPGFWLGGSRVSALRLFCLVPPGHL